MDKTVEKGVIEGIRKERKKKGVPSKRDRKDWDMSRLKFDKKKKGERKAGRFASKRSGRCRGDKERWTYNGLEWDAGNF